VGQPFPKGFLWGAATAAYQIEGSPLADGAAPSNWHRFAHTPGLVRGGDTGDVACDHYRRWRQDVALMREIGLTAYRFSISWSRVMPEGVGLVNERGLDFYRRLVDALVEAGIAPMATLFHWDLPAALEDRGGWLNPDSASWFADYASVAFRALDEGVRLWATLNEPWVVTDGGYYHGVLAPGHRNAFEAPIAAHNLLRAHAAGLAAYRKGHGGRKAIGIVVNLAPKHPASGADADRAAAARADAYMNRQFLDPIFLGSYPAELPEMYADAWPHFPVSDFDAIRAPVDFVGINYYTRNVVRADPKARPDGARPVSQPGLHTEMKWEVYPDGLFETLAMLRERYGSVPLYVTENGAAFADPRPRGGVVEDPMRVEYLREHLAAARRAIAAGVDLRGYFVWSLLDNFEWSQGYSKRFGIVRVDYRTQKRTLKGSALEYRRIIESNGAVL
jgi:beta-glucosidase